MNRYKIIFRIAADLALIGLVAWAPWWAILIAGVAFAVIFAPYYEIIAAGLAYDVLYGLRGWIGTVSAFIIFAAAEIVSRRIRR